MASNTFLTALGNGSQVPVSGTNRTGGTGDQSQFARLRTTLNRLLGGDDSISMTTSQAVDLDAYQGPPRSAMGLSVAVSGRATVVNADVAEHLISYQDPIKTLLDISVHKDHRVIVKRKFVRGGAAEVVPERSQARTVSVVEEEHEAILTRYGADIEMSTDLMSNEPDEAAADLNLKLSFQKNVLDEKLTEIGYQTIMSEGLSLNRALLEHSPQYSSLPEYERARVLDQIAADHTFAFDKYDQAFSHLLATVKRATPVTSSRFDTVILPSGLPDIEKLKPANSKFFLSGVSNPEKEKISFDLNQTFIDVPSGMTVGVHYPRVNRSNGQLRPRLEPSGLQRIRTFATFHRCTNDANPIRVVNLHTGVLETVDGSAAKKGGTVFVRPRIRCLTSSMVVGAKGCGELLMAYPLTSVSSVATAPEQMRMQLRVFLGSALFKSEDCVIVEDVKSEGVLSGGGTLVADNPNTYAENPDAYDGFFLEIPDLGSKPAFTYGAERGANGRSKLYVGDVLSAGMNPNSGDFRDRVQDSNQIDNDDDTFPTVVYQGSTWNATDSTPLAENCGHLSILDDPKLCKRLSGQNLVTERPAMVKIV